MDEFLLFYYLCWMIYIVVYFFMPLTTTRKLLLIVILIFICISPLSIAVSTVTISGSFAMLLAGTFIIFGFTALRIFELFVVFLCMINYTALLIWEKMTPVFFFMPANIMIASFGVFLVCILIRSFNLRMVIVITGFTLGQLMYESLLKLYVGSELIGSYHYTNYVLVAILVLIIYEGVKEIIKDRKSVV